ncbi:MAG: hypothetical protein ACFB2W_19300 [Leptolyngbyaceae cyanobacterium]
MTQFDKNRKADSDKSIPLSRLKTNDKIPLRLDKPGKPRPKPPLSDDKLSKLMDSNHKREDSFSKRFSKVSPTNTKRYFDLDSADGTRDRQSNIQKSFSPAAKINDQQILQKIKSLKRREKPLKQLEETYISSHPTICSSSDSKCNAKTPVRYRKYIFLFQIVIIISLLVWYIRS